MVDIVAGFLDSNFVDRTDIVGAVEQVGMAAVVDAGHEDVVAFDSRNIERILADVVVVVVVVDCVEIVVADLVVLW